MNYITVARRRAQDLDLAVDLIRKNVLSVRAAAVRYHLPKSTVQNNVKRVGRLPSPPRRAALSDSEEDVV